jgi:hypothetical protein
MAWGTYLLRKSLALVFIRFRVRARHHGKLPGKYKKIRVICGFFFFIDPVG